MKYPILLGAVLVLALLLTACGPAATSSPVVEPTTVMTEPPTEAATDAATTETTPAADTTTTAGVPVTGAATVMLNDVGTFGSVLTDAEGRSLYLFTNDTQNSGTSSCTGECLVNWPPLLSDGDTGAGEGVDETMLGTITLPDGTTQVTYNGWPLYYYAEDTAAGDANGQGVGDVWFLVTPAGEAVP